ncbi:DUF806 family protein [Weissella paramesenteroides]|uniref:DUF806 family protein n=1 Tax=Weissella paramesenteroides TaxID=1249 RepID=UPI001238FA3E|nr:DUF806 family protein [Weissella paramesenteroides]KAA8446936.1 DUF806 family protein [Weissella paramesenteroides]KAA8450572.1 DUF806 family protein [Weissella paramesenteroides]
MRPVDEVADVITGLFADWQVYSDAIPEEVIDDRHVTQVLLTEAQSDVSEYGGNTFNMMSLGVDIQIFYSLDYDKNMLLSEVILMKQLEDARWRVVDSQAHYLDLSQTDNQQTIKNITVNKTVLVDEIG